MANVVRKVKKEILVENGSDLGKLKPIGYKKLTR